MPDTSTASFLARIRELMDQLPPTERRLGTFILDFPGELASYSASELAGLADDNRRLTGFLRATHAVCESHNDVASTSLIENWIDEAERRTWFLYESTRAER